MASLTPQQAAAGVLRPGTRRGDWRWSQQWRDVLFLHWPAPARWLQDQLPVQLELDLWQGEAWVSFVNFRLQGVRLLGWPAVPFCSQMLEVNLRTYVRYRDEPAIFFLSMHADHRAMVTAARWLTPLPYSLARLEYQTGPGSGQLICQPWSDDLPLLETSFRLGKACGCAERDSLDAWLMERYVAYVADSHGLLRMTVCHEPWRFRSIELQLCKHRVDVLAGSRPQCHYSDGVSALLSPFARV